MNSKKHPIFKKRNISIRIPEWIIKKIDEDIRYSRSESIEKCLEKSFGPAPKLNKLGGMMAADIVDTMYRNGWTEGGEFTPYASEQDKFRVSALMKKRHMSKGIPWQVKMGEDYHG